jgi:hypothetical protein
VSLRSERKTVDIALVKLELGYQPETGVFTWLVGPRAGRVAGSRLASGYLLIKTCGQRLYAHRLAWMFVHGDCPPILDHVDGDRANNRIANLRPATQSQNMWNMRVRRASASGLKGVSWVPKRRRWRAMIGAHGKRKTLGHFATKEEAYACYCKAAKEMHGDFSATT